MLGTLVERNGGRCDLTGAGPEILGVQLDSRAIRPGDLFVALKGEASDGRKYVQQAIEGGATAILVQDTTEGGLGPVPSSVPVWVHREARRVAGEAAAEVLDFPATGMSVFAITGTNGKTTTAHLIAELLRACGRRPALIGTTGIQLADGVQHSATHTTPDAPQLQRWIAQHRDLGGDCVVLEVSSHALCQERTAGLKIDFGIFTNLSREHLDYHGDMQQYAVAKSRMFSSLQNTATAIINRDDRWSPMMMEAAKENNARVITYSAEEQADLHASELSFDTDASYLTLSGMGISLARLRIHLSGRFNVSNVLAASAAVLMSGASPSAVVAGLASVSPPPGRLEPVLLEGADAPRVFVDYAHTPDALRKVLGALREVATSSGGRLLCVFGCGGDRDLGKRSEMGATACELADEVFVTSDNPRTEDPLAILEDIRRGTGASARAHFEVDRRLAIRAALQSAAPGDLILIAGKGHETVQTIGHARAPFDDRQVALEEWT